MNVKQTHPVRKVFVVDLVSLCYENSDICENLKFIKHKINFNNLNKFRYGDVDNIFQKSNIVHRSVIWGKNGIDLRNDYLYAVYSYPFSIIKIKIKTFTELIRLKSIHHWFFDLLMANNFNLKQKDNTRSIRIDIRQKLYRVVNNNYLRFISGYHLIWFVINIIALFVLTYKYFKHRKHQYFLYLIILLIPLSYYLSYLLAVNGHDFRFMYPSTLLIQIVFLNYIIYLFVELASYVHIRLTR